MNKLTTKLKNSFSGEGISYSFVIALVIPVIIDQFFLVSFNFINTAMISSSGPEAVSAVNMVGSIHMFLIQIFASVGLGGTVLIAQYYGQKNYKMISQITSSTVFGALFVALLLSVFGLLFHDEILHLLFGEADPGVLANAKIYLIGLLCSYPMQAVVEGTNGSLRGIGRTIASLKLSLLINAVYIVLNLIFVVGLGMSVFGLTISLNLSRLVGLLFAIYTLYVNREKFQLTKKNFKRVQPKLIKQIYLVSIPFAAEQMFFNGGKIIVQMMIVSLGTNAIAAFAIASSWIQLGEIIPSALSTSLVPIVGQSIGRGKINDARKLTKSFVFLGMAAILAVDGTLLPFFFVGMRLFNPPAVIIPLIFQMVVVALVMHFLVWSCSFILPSALRAAGDSKFTTLVSLSTMWLFRIGMGYIVGILLGYGLIGIYVVMTLEWAIRGGIFLWRFKGDRWHQHKLI